MYIETPKFKDGEIISGSSFVGFNGFGLILQNRTKQFTDFDHKYFF
jgi:hypothetical protein